MLRKSWAGVKGKKQAKIEWKIASLSLPIRYQIDNTSAAYSIQRNYAQKFGPKKIQMH